MPEADPNVIYVNPRGWRVRLVQLVCYIALGVILWLAALYPPQTSLVERLPAFFGAAVMAAAVWGMEAYLRIYVIALGAAEGGLRITTLSTFGRTEIVVPRSKLRLGGDYGGESEWAPGVDAIASGLHVEGRSWPYLIDVTPPASLNEAALSRALASKPAASS